MKHIVYYKVRFAKENFPTPSLRNADFEKWNDAVAYLEECMKNVKTYCSNKTEVLDIISEYKKECPFEKEYSLTYQLTAQDSNGFCRVYLGRVEKSRIILK